MSTVMHPTKAELVERNRELVRQVNLLFEQRDNLIIAAGAALAAIESRNKGITEQAVNLINKTIGEIKNELGRIT